MKDILASRAMIQEKEVLQDFINEVGIKSSLHDFASMAFSNTLTSSSVTGLNVWKTGSVLGLSESK